MFALSSFLYLHIKVVVITRRKELCLKAVHKIIENQPRVFHVPVPKDVPRQSTTLAGRLVHPQGRPSTLRSIPEVFPGSRLDPSSHQ